MSEDFNPTPSDDYATLRRQFGALVTVIRGNNAQFAVYESQMIDLRTQASLSNKEAIEALRNTNEQLTNLNESLESHNRELLAVIAAKDEALKAAQVALDTYDYTGTKEDADKYIKAERLCAEAISFRPGDVELVEVGETGSTGMVEFYSKEVAPKEYKTKIYTIQIKNNTE